MRYDAVLYDHDGTLVDSLPMVVAATNAVLVRHGFPAEPPQVVIDAMVYATTPRMGFHARGSDPALHPRLAEEFYAEARRLVGRRTRPPTMGSLSCSRRSPDAG
jgi:phosphoglycolate phosphatase-like HAD superfamily hydrolase